jgi:CHASE4 domain.
MLAMFLALTAILFICIHTLQIKPLVAEVEKHIYNEDASVVKAFTTLRHDNMLGRLRGFAKWGKLDAFISLSPAEREEYSSQHMERAQPVGDSFSIISLFNDRDELLFGRVIDIKKNIYIPVTDKVKRWLDTNAPQVFAVRGNEVTGFVSYEGEPGLLASVPVWDSAMGKAVGKVVGIDYFDSVVLMKLANLVQGEFELVDDGSDPRMQLWTKRLAGGDFIHIDDDSVYSTVFIPENMDGSRTYGIAFKRPIDTDTFASDSLFSVIASALILFLIFSGLLTYVIEKFTLKPIENLTLTMKRLLGTGGQKTEVEDDYFEPLKGLALQVKRLVYEQNETEAERVKISDLNLNQERLTRALGQVIDMYLSSEPGSFQLSLAGMAEVLDLDFIAFYSLIEGDLMRSAKYFRQHGANSSNQLTMVGERVKWVETLVKSNTAKTLYKDGIFPEEYEELKQIMEYYLLKRVLCLPLRGSERGGGLLLVGSSYYIDTVWTANEKRILALTGNLLLAMSSRVDNS